MENGKLYICKDGEFEELAGIASLDDISIEEKEEDNDKEPSSAHSFVAHD